MVHGMTGREALGVLPETGERKHIDGLCQAVENDLEMLEILKRYTTANGSLFKFINDIRCPDEDFRKVKEWLEND